MEIINSLLRRSRTELPEVDEVPELIPADQPEGQVTKFSSPPFAADMVIGQYSLVKELGNGRTAFVWLAKEGDREVVIKIYRSGQHKSWRTEIRAAKIIKKLVNTAEDYFILPSDVATYQHVCEHLETRLFIYTCMSHGGTSLRQLMHDRGKEMSLQDKLKIISSLLTALKALHEHEIIHCDVSPRNVLVDSSLRARLCDFDQATPSDTYPPSVIGTPGYVSPEALSYTDDLTVATDVWSASAIAYEIITGDKLIQFDDDESSESSTSCDDNCCVGKYGSYSSSNYSNSQSMSNDTRHQLAFIGSSDFSRALLNLGPTPIAKVIRGGLHTKPHKRSTAKDMISLLG